MNKRYTDINLITCVQGNTVRKTDSFGIYETGHDTCVVYDFRRKAPAADLSNENDRDRKKRIAERKKASRARARKVRTLRTVLAAVLLTAVIFGIGGIASRAKSKDAPKAYKYYDTITVAYQENLLDIVQRYDDRNYYETQNDYLTELCRINNLEYDKTSYPVVTPGTHLVVPYYSTELK